MKTRVTFALPLKKQENFKITREQSRFTLKAFFAKNFSSFVTFLFHEVALKAAPLMILESRNIGSATRFLKNCKFFRVSSA